MLADLPPWLVAVLLGLVQGLTEFLPVSSSAHLVLLPELGGGEYLGKSFDVALHVGTLGAVLLYFRHEVEALVRALAGLAGERIQAVPGRRSRAPLRRAAAGDPVRRQALLLLVATVPAGVVGLLLEDWIERTFHGVPTIAGLLVGFALLLGLADRLGSHARDLGSLRPGEALAIGGAQALALMPGVSRSGATMTAALALGLSREHAARFSFLMSIPVIAGAGILKARPWEGAPGGADLAVLGAGAAFLSGLACIHWLLGYLRSGSFLPFVAYRIALGLLLLGWSLKA